MTNTTYYLLSLLAVLSLTGCFDDDDNRMTIVVDTPATYAFTRDGASTVSFSGQTTRLTMADELATALLDFDRTEEELQNMFTNAAGTEPFTDPTLNASGKNLRSKVAASRDLFFTDASRAAEIRTTFDGWISAQVGEVFPARDQLAGPGTPGQVADGATPRYVNAWGLEYNQAFTKGLIGALMYDQVANNYLRPSVLDGDNRRADNDAGVTEDGTAYTAMEHRWDEAYGYVFGAAADPLTAPLADLGTADGYLNKYLGRVNADADFAGIAARIDNAFRRGRAAIVAGNYEVRDEQAAVIRKALRDVILIRAVYYLMQGKANLEATPTEFGAAFHDLSEGYGFVYGLNFLVSYDTDEVLDHRGVADQTLATLRNEAGNGFWDVAPAALEEAATEIAGLSNFTVEQAGS